MPSFIILLFHCGFVRLTDGASKTATQSPPQMSRHKRWNGKKNSQEAYIKCATQLTCRQRLTFSTSIRNISCPINDADESQILEVMSGKSVTELCRHCLASVFHLYGSFLKMINNLTLLDTIVGRPSMSGWIYKSVHTYPWTEFTLASIVLKSMKTITVTTFIHFLNCQTKCDHLGKEYLSSINQTLLIPSINNMFKQR